MPRLSARVESFYRWLWRWYGETGDLHASTGYYARKQGVTERTVYNWLRALKAAGRIRAEVEEGVCRRIVPLAPPPQVQMPPRPRRAMPGRPLRSPRDSGSASATAAAVEGGNETDTPAPTDPISPAVSGVSSGVVFRGLSATTHPQTQDATTQLPGQRGSGSTDAVVAELVREGVFAPVAARIVAEAGEKEAREQITALPYRRPRDRAALLVCAIRQRWALPAALLAEREKRRARMARRERDAAARAQTARREAEKEEMLLHLSQLPGEARQELERKAEAEAMRMLPPPLAEKARASRSHLWQASVRQALLNLMTCNKQNEESPAGARLDTGGRFP